MLLCHASLLQESQLASSYQQVHKIMGLQAFFMRITSLQISKDLSVIPIQFAQVLTLKHEILGKLRIS